jgi:hypothetical protein
MHINVTYIVIIVMPQHASMLYQTISGVTAPKVGVISPKHVGALPLHVRYIDVHIVG